MKLKTYNRKIDKFLKDLDYICTQDAVQIVFTNRNYVKCNGTKTSGYFDEKKREIVCALKVNNTEWISTLAHESCHLDQWREKCVELENFDKHNIDQDDWLNHKIELSEEQQRNMTQSYKELEWDCEKRTIEKIKKYDLPIDLVWYKKQAVVYIMLYDFVEKYRTWYKAGSSPCTKEDICNLIPEDYNLNELPIITEEIEELMAKYILGDK